MTTKYYGVLTLAAWVSMGQGEAASLAGKVVNYDPGALPASLSSYTNTAAILGEPSRVTPGQWGGPVDPFNPPYTTGQLLALGTNGTVTVEFPVPLPDDPTHPYGLDFILFGSSGFIISNGDYTGAGITDGTLFGAGEGNPRIYISEDNRQYYQLDPTRVNRPSAPWPTDGQGNFGRPLNPDLTPSLFAGKNMAAIRRLYDGSAGGTGCDIRWARDTEGRPVTLSSVRFVRIVNPDGFLKLDGIAAVSPTGNLAENFDLDPLAAGWHVWGESTLFKWDTTQHRMGATWDSSKANSFFYHPLPMALNKEDSFSLAFDLRIDSLAAGVNPDKPFAFELAAGLIDRASAFSTNFLRGTGADAANLVEFDYFPDTGFGATISMAVASSEGRIVPSFTVVELTADALFHVAMVYTATNHTLTTTMTKDSQPFGPIKEVVLGTNFSNFSVDAMAISSYSDQGAEGSILGMGVIDNIEVNLPVLPPPTLSAGWVENRWQASVNATANWSYTLERSTNTTDWFEAASQTAATSGPLSLTDNQKPDSKAFYRVRAVRKQ